MRGAVDLSEQIPVDVLGSTRYCSVLKAFDDERTLSLQEIAALSLITSDNRATVHVMSRHSFADVGAVLRDCGCSDAANFTVGFDEQDLGLASIDMLDLLFSLNTMFDMYIRPQDVQAQLLGGMTEEDFLNPDRTVSEKGYARIIELVPDFNRDELEAELTDADLFNFFKVRHIIDLVEEKLAERDTAS